MEFDERLRQRLVAFQAQQGLTADGVADADTWTALVSGAHGNGAAVTQEAVSGGDTPAGAVGNPCNCEVDDEAATPGADFDNDPDSPDLVGVYEDNGEGDAGSGDSGEMQAGHAGKSSSGVPGECRATAKACFSISRRTAWLLGPKRQVVLAVPALGGRPGHETHVGHFNVHFHDRNHVSSKYHAPMPFYVNFAPEIGFHQGSLSVQSHGCVHLSRDNAERFFNYLKDGDQVDVVP